MTKMPTDWKPRRVPQRTSPHQTSPEEKARLNTQREARYQKARAIFEKLRPQLINEYYNCYITIEPDTGEYFLSQDDMEAFHKLREKQPKAKTVTFCLNETGVCGRI